MVKAELKNGGHIEVRVEGDIRHLIIELHAVCVAVAEMLGDEKNVNQFLDELPSMCKGYREHVKDRIVIDKKAIRKERNNGDII